MPVTRTKCRPAAHWQVDRGGFSAAVTAAIERNPFIEIHREEIAGLPPADWESVIISSS